MRNISQVFLLLMLAVCSSEYLMMVDGASARKHSRNRTRKATCISNQFSCTNGQCIDNTLVCDSRADCDDKSDETKSLCSKLGVVCPSYTFQCAYGACIDGHAKCNGVADCIDGSDETGQECSKVNFTTTSTTTAAPKKKCGKLQFACSSGECIDESLFCDGKEHCVDGSDETSAVCGNILCDKVYFQCTYGACINRTSLCDGVSDCIDGSDETSALCPNKTDKPGTSNYSSPKLFTCENGQVIDNILICDGEPNCDDKSDETKPLCSKLGLICPNYSFQCAYGACIDGHARCDGVIDCIDGSDEQTPDCSKTQKLPVATTVSSTSPSKGQCRDDQFLCKSGKCVSKFSVCDGTRDCDDSSDEVASVCKNFKCEDIYFRCAYGACVNSDAKCDGTNDCLDGSDELPSICPHALSDVNSTNSFHEFYCKDGQIIDRFLVCDGQPNCDDKSDETKYLCSKLGLICPNYAFQCDYGACVDGHARCNGVKDCIDGSDEDFPDCPKTLKPPVITHAVNVNVQCSKDQFKCKSGQCISKYSLCDGKRDCDDASDETSSTCKDIENNGCQVPPPLPGGQYILSECSLSDTRAECVARGGTVMPFGSELSLRCVEGYSVSGFSNVISCGRHKSWNSTVLPKCQKTCKPLASQNLIVECSLTEVINNERFTKNVSCSEPMFEGSRAIARCPALFKPREDQYLFCLSSGDWDTELAECQLLCGNSALSSPTSLSKSSTASGENASPPDFPWHVGIYWASPQTNSSSKYYYKCGGSLVSPSTVLTDAKCGYNKDTKEWIPAKSMIVAFGEKKSSWDENDENIQKIPVESFLRPEPLSGQEDAFDVGVIILKSPTRFTKNVLPMCLNFSPVEDNTALKVQNETNVTVDKTSSPKKARSIRW